MAIWLLLNWLISGEDLPAAIRVCGYSTVGEIYLLAKAQIHDTLVTLLFLLVLLILLRKKKKSHTNSIFNIFGLKPNRHDCTNSHFGECTWLCAIFSSFKAPAWEGRAAESTERFPCSWFRFLGSGSTYQKAMSWCPKNIWDCNFEESSEDWFLFVF